MGKGLDHHMKKGNAGKRQPCSGRWGLGASCRPETLTSCVELGQGARHTLEQETGLLEISWTTTKEINWFHS